MKIPTILALVSALLLVACGSNTDPQQQIPNDPPTFTNLSGTWGVGENLVDNCQDGDFASYDMFATQNGAAIQVTDEQGRSYTGTMAGNQIFPQVPFSYNEEGGVTTVTQLTITALSEVELEGNSVWSWTNGSESCSGTSTFSAFKK